VQVDYQSVGSGGGVKALIDGALLTLKILGQYSASFALSSRD
jgi:ABC-type phosphate transport system substrate-binding protein